VNAPTTVGLAPQDIAEGDELTPVLLDIDRARVATLVAATWDTFPGHHDPAYARAQGQKDIFLNTMVLSGFVDRVALNWAGPHWFLRRRAMRMLGSVYPGDVLTGTGTVKSVTRGEDGTTDVVVSVVASTGAGPCVAAEITLRHGNGLAGSPS
jgi:acyl dehydratase